MNRYSSPSPYMLEQYSEGCMHTYTYQQGVSSFSSSCFLKFTRFREKGMKRGTLFCTSGCLLSKQGKRSKRYYEVKYILRIHQIFLNIFSKNSKQKALCADTQLIFLRYVLLIPTLNEIYFVELNLRFKKYRYRVFTEQLLL